MKIHRKTRRTAGFTLVELLVVITIIAVLAGMSFAGVNMAIRKAKSTEAEVMAGSIAAAIENFYGEYGRLPEVGSNRIETDAGSRDLLEALLGLDTTENPRSIIFLQGKEAKSATGKGGGIAYAGEGSVNGIYDPFGSPYTIELNTSYDDALQFTFGGQRYTLRGKQVAVYSPGSDEDPGTGDDIKSWE